MKTTVIAIAAVIVILVAALAYFRVGIFAPTAQAPAPVPTEQTTQAPADIEATLDGLDVGADLDRDFVETDTDIRAL